MKRFRFTPAAIAASLFALVPMFAAPLVEPSAPQTATDIFQDDYGSGTIKAEGKAPGGDPSVVVTKDQSNTGKIKITSVRINGVEVPKEKYTVNDQGSVSPEIVFHEPDPGAPKKDDLIQVYGTCENGDKSHTGKLKWR